MMLTEEPPIGQESIEAQVDCFSVSAWQQALRNFRDANIYNTWHYETAVHPNSRVSRILLTRSGVVLGAVQARIVSLPVVSRGVAFIRWGPMWKPKDAPADPEALRACLRAVFSEYALRRKLLVRIIPALYEDDSSALAPVFATEGFRPASSEQNRRTLIMDLKPSIEQIHENLHVKWRAHLKRALKKPQQVTSGQTDDFFTRFASIYTAMRERKGFVSFTDFQAFRRLQGQLGPAEKSLVILCGDGSEYYSGAIVSALGEVGLYLFGATNGRGLENNGSYPVQWHALQWLKQQGCLEYDLNGINPEANPSTYMYKSRLAGKNRREVRELGVFEACADPAGRVVINAGLGLLKAWRSFRLRRNRSRNGASGQDEA